MQVTAFKKRKLYYYIVLFFIATTILLSILLFVGCGQTNTPTNTDVDLLLTVKYIALEGGKIRSGDDWNSSNMFTQLVDFGMDAEKAIAVPDEGYYFVKWSDGVTDFTRQEKKVKNDLELNAEFALITDPVTVCYTIRGIGMIRGSTKQTIQRGTEAQPVEAILYGNELPENIFVRWSDGLIDAYRQDVCVSESVEVTAEFGHTINYGVVGNGSIIGNSSQAVVYGEYAETVTAMPDKGYRFVEWSDGMKTATRTDWATVGINVSAIFEWRDTDIFAYHFNYATDNCYEDGLTLTRGKVDGKMAAVPTRDFFTFGGWYLDEKFTQKAFDINGNNILGEEIFNSPSRDLYAKWNVKEEYVTTYKILMVYVAQINGTFVGNDGQNIEVHYTMPQELRAQCIELTKCFRDTLNDMLDGLVNFEIHSYFTAQSVDEACFSNEGYNTNIYAYQIPELKNSGVLENYRSILTIYSFGKEKNLLTSWAGIGDKKYAAIPLDEILIQYNGINKKALMDYGCIIGTCVHEFIHTVEFDITCYEYHRAISSVVPTKITDKLFLLNQFPTDFYNKLYDNPELWNKEYFLEAWKSSDKAGVPYGYWANEIIDVTIKPECINGRPDGYGGVGTVDTGGYIDCVTGHFANQDWWHSHGAIGYTHRIPKGSRSTLFTAVPKSGYRFIGWSDGIKDELRILTDVQENITLIAYFERSSYTIEYIAGEGGRIEGETIQNVLTGDRTTVVTVIPDIGYTFIGWSDGNKEDYRFDVVGQIAYDENGESYLRFGFSVTAIFEKNEAQ